MMYGVNVCNFADDTAPLACDQELENVLKSLEEHTEIGI